MKKIIFLFLTAILMILVLSSCSNKTKLYIYSWSEYYPSDLIAKFEKENNCEVVYDVFASNEEMFTKLKAGASGYDIVFPSGDHVQMMTKENMLGTIDKTKIPNFKNISKNILDKITFDKGNKFSVPYLLGSTGIAVNKKYVKKYDKSWNIYERADLKDKLLLLDDKREVIGSALKYLGYSINTTNQDELNKAKELLLKWKSNILRFDALSYAKGFGSEEFWVVHGYGENIIQEIDSSMQPYFDFFIPKEGSTLWMDSMVMLKDSKNKELAYKFINFTLDPQNFAVILDKFRLPSPNIPAEKYIKNQPIYSFEEIKDCEFINDLGADVKLYDKLWQDIRVGEN